MANSDAVAVVAAVVASAGAAGLCMNHLELFV
jgi:hypothetical protein